MPMINLIEEQRLAVRRDSARTKLAFFGFVGVLAASVVGFGFLLFLTEGKESEIARAKAIKEKLAPIQKEIDDNNALVGELKPRLSTLEKAQESTLRWSRILDHLTKQTPGSMWLTSLRAVSSDPTKPIQASMQGMTDRLEPIGEFILRLEGSDDLGTVELKFAQERVVAEGTGIEFEVAANIEGTAEEQPKKKEAKKSS